MGEEQLQRRRNGEVRGGKVAAGFPNNMEIMAGYDWGWGTSIRIQAKQGLIFYWEKEARRQKLVAIETYQDKRQKKEAKLMGWNNLRPQAPFTVGPGTPFNSKSHCKH